MFVARPVVRSKCSRGCFKKQAFGDRCWVTLKVTAKLLQSATRRIMADFRLVQVSSFGGRRTHYTSYPNSECQCLFVFTDGNLRDLDTCQSHPNDMLLISHMQSF